MMNARNQKDKHLQLTMAAEKEIEHRWSRARSSLAKIRYNTQPSQTSPLADIFQQRMHWTQEKGDFHVQVEELEQKLARATSEGAKLRTKVAVQAEAAERWKEETARAHEESSPLLPFLVLSLTWAASQGFDS